MAQCTVCGCELEAGETTCAFCGAPVASKATPTHGAPVASRVASTREAPVTSKATPTHGAPDTMVVTAASSASVMKSDSGSKPRHGRHTVTQNAPTASAASRREIETIDEPTSVGSHARRGRHTEQSPARQAMREDDLEATLDEPIADKPELTTLNAQSLSVEAEVAVRKGNREQKVAQIRKEKSRRRDSGETKKGKHSSPTPEPESARDEISQAVGVNPKVVRIAIIVVAVIVVIAVAALIVTSVGTMSLKSSNEQQGIKSPVSILSGSQSSSSAYENYGNTPASSQGGGYIAEGSGKLFLATNDNIMRATYESGQAGEAEQVVAANGAKALNVYQGNLYYLDTSGSAVYEIKDAASVEAGQGAAVEALKAAGSEKFLGLCIEDGVMYLLASDHATAKVEMARCENGTWKLDSQSATLQEMESATMGASETGIQVVVQYQGSWSLYERTSSTNQSVAFTKQTTQKGTIRCVSVTGKQYVGELSTAQSLNVMTSGGSTSPVAGATDIRNIGLVKSGEFVALSLSNKVYHVYSASLSADDLTSKLNPDGKVVRAIGTTRDGYYCALLSDGSLNGYNPDSEEKFNVEAQSK